MPCTKCSNGKWRYGSGGCVFETKAKCREAEQAIHARKDILGNSYDMLIIDECPASFEETKSVFIDTGVLDS